ncbi:MAG: glycoside hydrolase family 2 protein [Acidimicrobiales bacterium]
MVSHVDLSGTWRAAPADEAGRRDYQDPAFDDTSWALATVPGHWRSNPAFADTDGPVLHRTTFAGPGPFGPGADGGTDRRSWLVLDGVFYTSDVWLDGTYLGDTEGYFFPHAFEVTDALAAASEHTLALEVACPRPSDLTAKRNLTGVFQHWDQLDQGWNPGGIWRPVRLEQSGPVRIRHARVRCGDVNDERAIVSLRAVLDTVEARSVDLVTTIAPRGSRGQAVEVRRSQPLAAGENRVEWTVAVPDPQLWWPHALGDQPLYDVHVAVLTESGASSDERRWPLGLRTVELRDWIATVNGERLFLKGTNLGPTRMALAEAEPAEIAGDIDLALDAGLDLVRVHGHISRPELYAAADEAGMLVWQDLPLQWGYSRTVRQEARRQAREAVDLLAHHPSLFLWCGHNEPMALDVEPATLGNRRGRRRLAVRMAAAQVLPSWNRSLLDRAVKTVLERDDGTRPVVAHSGMLPHLPQLDGTDSHLYLGWFYGEERDLPGLIARWPRLARFVGEFGAQAVPDHDDFVGPDRWPDLDWDRLAERHALQKPMFDRHVPPAEFATYDEWKDATRHYQARVVRYHVETLRRLKYQPTGGFAQFCLADSSPAISAALLDHERAPKPAFAALRDACRPVIVVADRPPEHVHPGDHLSLDVHVVSDARIAFRDMVVRAHLSFGTERRHAWSWSGVIQPDACVRVGRLEIDVPEPDHPVYHHRSTDPGTDDSGDLPGEPSGEPAERRPDPGDGPVALVIDLELVGPGLDVTNHYGTWVVGGAHAH